MIRIRRIRRPTVPIPIMLSAGDYVDSDGKPDALGYLLMKTHGATVKELRDRRHVVKMEKVLCRWLKVTRADLMQLVHTNDEIKSSSSSYALRAANFARWCQLHNVALRLPTHQGDSNHGEK